MANYLSPEWFEHLGAACRGTDVADEEQSDKTLVLQHLVSAAPSGEVSYYLRLSEDGVTIVPGRAPHPDVTFAEDYATAAAIAKGDVTAPAALLAGRIRVGGNLSALVTHQGMLAIDDPIPVALRATTTF